MKKDDLIAAVRAELGRVVNVVDIGDGDIEREASFILSRINDRIFCRTYRYIVTEANVREYDVEETTVRVQCVLPYGVSLEDEVRIGLPMTASSFDSHTYSVPSLWAIEAALSVRNLRRVRWEYDAVGRKLKIDPTPSTTGEKIWYVSVERTRWTIETLPSEFEDVLVVGTVWRALEIVALRRSTEGGILREGGRVDYPADSLKRFADSKREDFFSELALKARLYNL